MTYRHFNNETTRSSVLRAVANTENEAAWQRLFDLYAGFVFSIARHKGLNETDADDIVQVVFADLARNLPTFKYDRAKGRFRSYLTGLVNWRVMDRLKASKRDAELKANFWEEAKSAATAEDEDFEEREWQQAASRRRSAESNQRSVPSTTRRLSQARSRDRTLMSSRSSTEFPATTSTKYASASRLNCKRRRRKSLPRWTSPVRLVLGLDCVRYKRDEPMLVLFVEPGPLSV